MKISQQVLHRGPDQRIQFQRTEMQFDKIFRFFSRFIKRIETVGQFRFQPVFQRVPLVYTAFQYDFRRLQAEELFFHRDKPFAAVGRVPAAFPGGNIRQGHTQYAVVFLQIHQIPVAGLFQQRLI